MPEIADRYGVSYSTVRRWISEKRFPNRFRRGLRAWRVPLADLHKFERQHCVKPVTT